MPKLNQIIAVVTGKKTRSTKLITDAHRGWNSAAIAGLTKTYRPLDDEGEKQPPEHKSIHIDVPARIRDTMKQVASFLDAVATQDFGNTLAKAPVEVEIDGSVKSLFGVDLPVTVMLFLEKRLIDLHTFVSQLPVLPPDREWKFDDGRNCFVTEPTDTLRTQKVQQPIVKYDATTEHPAQTELITRDVTVGIWTTTHMSSAIPEKNRAEMLRRIEALQDAVKVARERANSIEVEQKYIGKRLMEHIFGDLMK